MTPIPSLAIPRARWRELLLPLAILVLGIVIGASGTIVFGRGLLLQRFLRPADAIPGDVIQRVGDELRITPEERSKLQGIFEEHMRKVETIRVEGRASVSKELDSLREEVADVLGDERAEQWRARFEEARRAGARPGPPDRWGQGDQRGRGGARGPLGPPNGPEAAQPGGPGPAPGVEAPFVGPDGAPLPPGVPPQDESRGHRGGHQGGLRLR